MAINVTNQRPVELTSDYTDAIASPFDPYNTIKNEMIKPLFNALIPSSTVIIDEDGHPLSEDEITNSLIACSQDAVNTFEEKRMKSIFKQCLAYYNDLLPVQNIYPVQMAVKINEPMPGTSVGCARYDYDDIKTAAQQLLSGQSNAKERWIVYTAFTTRVNTFGYYFANDIAFSEFQTWFASEISNINTLLTQQTLDLVAQFCKIRLNYLTQSFVLRDDDTQNNDPYSFARLLPFYLLTYEQNNKNANKPDYIAGHMPFSFGEHVCPRTIVIMNVEKHAHAHPSEIKREWDIIQSAMYAKPKIMGLNKIANLTAVARMAQKMSGIACASANAADAAQRSGIIRFRKTEPTVVDITKYILAIYKKAADVITSENTVKTSRLTFQRPSRRNPDNPDLQGKMSALKYKPDLHIYLDCSGSISERNYQDAIKSLIRIAKRLNINFYFTSFSHYMSGTAKLHVKDKTVSAIYKEFLSIPKVAGGTNYEQIWHFINKHDRLQKEVSIVISDFEYSVPNHYVKHPRFLYYAPISGANWSSITRSAKCFVEQMLPMCPDIRKKLLM